jgi:hypothetical protein
MYLQIPTQLGNVVKAPTFFFFAFIITKIVSFMDFTHRLVF